MENEIIKVEEKNRTSINKNVAWLAFFVAILWLGYYIPDNIHYGEGGIFFAIFFYFGFMLFAGIAVGVVSVPFYVKLEAIFIFTSFLVLERSSKIFFIDHYGSVKICGKSYDDSCEEVIYLVCFALLGVFLSMIGRKIIKKLKNNKTTT
jgi:hypothetical protein